jgi:predicted dehydrogenase
LYQINFMVNIGVIGYGYWGPNLVRNFSGQVNGKVLMVADGRIDRLDLIRKTYPNIHAVSSAEELINNPKVDAVVIATAVSSHYSLAKQALLNGKHVLIEKPMTSSSKEAEELINLATQKNLVLMVDHTFLYTGAVQKIKELLVNDSIGKPRYFDSSRINLGLFQPDINVLWDLAPHDISILAFLVKDRPHSINATGISHTRNGIENIAYMTVNYANDFIAHFNCSWTSPVKIRQTLIGGDLKMIVYNDLEPSEKVRVYDTGYEHTTDEELNKIRVDYRSGDVFIPKLSSKEALFSVAEDFVNSIIEKRDPLANANLGLEVVKILEASQVSIKNKGKEVELK